MVRKKLPGRAAGTVLLADRSPLPLGEIRSPALPVLLPNARFPDTAVFRGLDSWHRWTAPAEVHAMVPLLQRASIVRIGRRARSGKPRRRQNASLHGMQETSFWFRLNMRRLRSTRPLLAPI